MYGKDLSQSTGNPVAFTLSRPAILDIALHRIY